MEINSPLKHVLFHTEKSLDRNFLSDERETYRQPGKIPGLKNAPIYFNYVDITT